MTCTFCNKTPVKHCPGLFFFNFHIWLIFTALATKLVQYNMFLRATMRLESIMRLESRALVGVPVGCGNIKQLQLYTPLPTPPIKCKTLQIWATLK